MCQNLDSYNILNEVRYKLLCDLYYKYKSAISTVINNVGKEILADNKLNELDKILAEVENYPISWCFYKKQSLQFSQEFENLIIFYDDNISNS